MLCCTPETILYVNCNWKFLNILKIILTSNSYPWSSLGTRGPWIVYNTYECSKTTWKVTHQSTVRATFTDVTAAHYFKWGRSEAYKGKAIQCHTAEEQWGFEAWLSGLCLQVITNDVSHLSHAVKRNNHKFVEQIRFSLVQQFDTRCPGFIYEERAPGFTLHRLSLVYFWEFCLQAHLMETRKLLMLLPPKW